ncbi:MAG: hypothetical protein QXU98_03910 [Candidatus Parvarchaeota archaeon]
MPTIFDYKHLVYGVAGALFGFILGYIFGTAVYAIVLSASIYNSSYLHSAVISATAFPYLFAFAFGAAGFGFGLLYSHEKDSTTK